MRDEDPICRNLKVKQDAFFRAAEREGFTLAVLSADTDIPVGTLASYRSTQAREPSIMSLATFVKLAAVVPPRLSSLLIEDSGKLVAARDGQDATWLRLGERAGAFAAKVCRFQSTDGHIDHREDADLRADMIEILTEGHGAIGAGQRP